MAGEADVPAPAGRGEAIGDTGRRVGAYLLVERVAPGSGQGEVFRGLDADGRPVAVKQVVPHAVGVHRIEEVHAALTRRPHPALAHQREVFRRDGDEALYVVAGWVEGDTLAARAPGATVHEVLSAAGVAVGRAGAGGAGDAAGEVVAPTGGPGFTRRALVDTRTTSGPDIDDQHSAYLSTEPVDSCRAFGCEVPGAAVATGMQVTLTCLTIGERVTNGNDRTPLDDDNDLLYESERWYGVRLADGTTGLLSEVWIHPDDRGGGGLPLC